MVLMTVYGRKLLYACQRVALLVGLTVCHTISTDVELLGFPSLDLAYRTLLLQTDLVSAGQVEGLRSLVVERLLDKIITSK